MEHSTEQRILATLRKLLARIVRELTPKPGMRHPLSDQTIEDVRQAFDLIATRERELLAEQGIEAPERPHYADEPKTAHTVAMPKRKNGGGT